MCGFDSLQGVVRRTGAGRAPVIEPGGSEESAQITKGFGGG